MVTIQNFNAVLVKLETNVKNYATFRSTTAPDVAENMRCMRAWVNQQVADSRVNSQHKAIADFGNVIATSVDSLNSLSSGDPLQVMKGCLGIAASVSAAVGGPFGAAAAAICGILGSILSISTSKEPDLATVFIEKVHVELKKFNQELKSQTFGGLQSRVRNMCAYLKSLKTKDERLPDQALFETDFPQFIGEVAHNFIKGLSFDSKEEDVHDCLTSMVVYCNAQTSLLLLLTNVLATFKSTGRETRFIKDLLRVQKEDAIQKLGHLSEAAEDMSSGFSDERGKLYVAFHLRNALSSYEIVEEFRQGLGMTRMPEIETIQEKAMLELFRGPKGITHLYPQPQTKGDNHYFQLINHTSVPIKVVCGGIVGDNVNGLEFRQDVEPFSSYEHIATKSTWNFSTGGFFIIYLDGKKRSFDSRFQGQGFKVFEFALSNPFIGFRKSAILEKTDNLLSTSGNDCWKQMTSNNSPPIHFVHGDKHYVVSGGYTSTVYIKGVNDYPGENGCLTWRFVVQEYDPREDMEQKECVIL